MAAYRFRPLLSCTRALLLLTAACGGGTTSTDDPSDVGPPASVAVNSGDNQVAAGGAAVATAPSIIVRDAAGRAVPGVAVAFSVDSGGGSVASPTTTTNASGIASSGTWTLGAAGPQVLGAVAGTLPKLKLRATAQVTTTTIITQSIPTSGGTITINQSSSPFNGASITFAAGALPTATAITLGTAPTTGITLPAGMTLPAAALTIGSSAGRLAVPAFVRIPVAPALVANAVVVWHDPVTNAQHILPRLTSDASSITVWLPSLDFSQPAAGVRGFVMSLLSSIRAEEEVDGLLLLVALPDEVLTRTFDSQFRPGADDWDFSEMGIATLPFLLAPNETVVDPGPGMVASELWYFVNRRKAGGLPLSGSTQLQAGEPKSSRYGIRWGAYASRDVPSYFGLGSLLLQKFEELYDDDPQLFAQEQFLAIRAQFFMTSSRPVPILLSEALGEDGFTAIGVAFRVEGNTVSFSVPSQPGRTFTATLTPSGLTPIDIPLNSGRVARIVSVSGLMYAAMVQEDKLAAQYAQVSGKTLGNGQWPEPELRFKDGVLDTGKVFLDDKLLHWWECPGCPDLGFQPTGLPATASHVQYEQFGSATGGVWGGLGAYFSSNNFSNDNFAAGVTSRPVGFAVYLPMPGDPGIGTLWLDWRTVTYRRATLTPAPATVELAGEQSVTFTVTSDVGLPGGTRYSWVLITDDGRDSVETAAPTHTRLLRAGTVGTLRINAHEPVTKRIIAHTDVPITAGAAPFWIITSIADEDELLNEDLNGPGGEVFDKLTRLVASPHSGLIGVTQNGSASELFLRIKPTGIWTTFDNCCPPDFAPSDMKEVLGVSPAVQHPFGPFFSQFRTSSWTQSSTDLSTGTMTGQYSPGLIDYPVKNAGMQTGPDYGVRITATRTGDTMTGVITFINIFASDEGPGLEPGDIGGFRFPFTAVRIR